MPEVAKKKQKVGWRTSEFWATVLTVVGSIGTAVVGILPASVAAPVAAVATAAYALSRGLSKFGEAAEANAE